MKDETLDDVLVAKRVEINEDTPSVIVCVYGTLRTGESNHKRILDGTNSELLGTFKSEPIFTMYGRRSPFPILTEGSTSIIYEAFKINDQKVLDQLHKLEGCTGVPGEPNNWYDIVPMETPVGPGHIYLQHNFKSKKLSALSIIPSGDWKNKSI